MSLLLAFATLLTLSAPPAFAGVVVSVWSPGVAVFDPYDPVYVPAPRADYAWVPVYYDEFGYFVPGYWQPLLPNPGYTWSWGYWSGRTYYEGYWRPDSQPGQAWIAGYYVRGRYVSPRWVAAGDEARERERSHAHLVANEPPRAHHEEATHATHQPRHSTPKKKPKGKK